MQISGNHDFRYFTWLYIKTKPKDHMALNNKYIGGEWPPPPPPPPQQKNTKNFV